MGMDTGTLRYLCNGFYRWVGAGQIVHDRSGRSITLQLGSELAAIGGCAQGQLRRDKVCYLWIHSGYILSLSGIHGIAAIIGVDVATQKGSIDGRRRGRSGVA